MSIATQLSTPVQFAVPTSGSARILHQIRNQPGITRSELRDQLGMSQPTIARNVSALIDERFVTEIPASQVDGRAGRPSLGLRIDASHLRVWGIHIGLRSTEIVIADGAGRLLEHATLPLSIPENRVEDSLDLIAHRIKALGAAHPSPITVGMATSAHIDAVGSVTSEEYGWEGVPVGNEISQRLGAHVFYSTGVTAMAGYELAANDLSTRGMDSTLYFYVREMIGHAWIFNGAVHRAHSGTPTTALRLLDDGSIATHGAHPLSTRFTLDDARSRGLSVESLSELIASGDPRAREVLDARAHRIARAVAVAVDIVDPEKLVLAGEAFTADPKGLKTVIRDLRDMGGAPAKMRLCKAGGNVLIDAARQVALQPLWQEPLEFV
ncbi:ROK family transcriptional regulator [Corynebacterium lubricantis]|uniref:ROK family transcriptional regulator n=1 Tax=Corynebacterium lubricantis TaxID=541095 RepID=UPI0003770FE4|nr:ROK family transcriptional regulator [Corynebacterium lubricantis]